ncbi:MAG: hypothetical protein ACRYG6_04520, partial [Janthinobacterium lividum]
MPDAPNDSAFELNERNFPEEAYLDAFPDVRDAVQQGIVATGFDHWERFGRAEIGSGHRGRPACLIGPPRRVEAAGEAVPAPAAGEPVAEAPIEVVQAEPAPARRGRKSQKVEVAVPTAQTADEDRFNEEVYLAINPDVQDAVNTGAFATGYEHWLQYGREEERRGARPTITADAFYSYPKPPQGQDFIAETENFDSEGYMYLYPDVREAVGGRLDDARDHWRHHGRIEGRHGPGVAPYCKWSASVPGLLRKPFGLNIYGPFAATSGLGTAARALVRAVKTSGMPFELHNFDVSHGAARILHRDHERVPTYRINLILANADQIAWLTSLYPVGRFDDAYNIAVWAWELAAFRPEWFSAFGPLDEVWTNSEFEVESILAMSPVPVHKIRLPIEVSPAPTAVARDAFGIPHDRLVFLTAFDVGSTSERKNPRMVIEAFRQAFAGSDDVFLVIKF